MSAPTNAVTAGDVRGIPSRPALSEAEQARRAARPVRDPDPRRNAAYWARIDACVDVAPAFSPEQRAVIRAQFHAPQAREAA
ncbi:hypothetical protein ABZU94_29885 [Streptomyces mirabilis]|uniref:hypothetical protein n=1 Tax=Streptomyces sp. NPDC005388 TaxID=3156717 RepID=UPI0033A52B07